MTKNTPHSFSDALSFVNPALQAEFQQYATPVHIRAKKEITREG
ncbi:hypothetical protein [Chryseobacterium sp. MFBS3-17]|nr:hypothetical protein [Chryseobacterium sp. MFBS3-17]